jgi:L-iditol 2-dehydrogenase
MRALRKLQAGPSDLVVVEVPVPEPGIGQVRVAVFATGMCGTDLHIMDGTYASAPPVTLGHEMTGVVDAVGAGVDESWLGSRVCPAPAITCGICEWCRTGLPMHCPDRLSAGTSLDGGFAPYVVVPVRNLFRLPASVSEYAGALVEPLACVCNALMDPDAITPGDRVVVIGPGTIGILAAQVAIAAGAHVTLVGLGTDAPRLAIAAAMGIDARTLDDPQTRLDLDREGAAREIHAVIECSGAQPAVTWALSLLRPRGRLVQLGLMGDDSAVPLAKTILREVTITGNYGSTPMAWHRAIALLAAGRIQLDPLITSVLPLDGWQQAIAHFQNQQGIKTLFDPRLH